MLTVPRRMDDKPLPNEEIPQGHSCIRIVFYYQYDPHAFPPRNA